MQLPSVGTSHRSLRAAACFAATIALAAFAGCGICRLQPSSPASDNCAAYFERIRITDSLHRAFDFAAACETFETAFRTHPDCILPYHLYNAAYAAARDGRADGSLRKTLEHRMGIN